MSFISRSSNGNVCSNGSISSGNTPCYPGRRSRKFIAGPHARHFLYFDSAISKEDRMILFSQIFIFTRALCDFNVITHYTPATYLPSEYVEVHIITNPLHPAYGQAGLFAKRNIPNGTIVTPYAGFLEIFNTSCNSRTYTMGFGKYNDDCALDAEFAGNFGRFANDPRGVLGGSANLSAESRYNARGEAFTALVARRQIAKDDEILMSYGKAHSLHPSAWIDVYGKPLLRQREGGVIPVPLTHSSSEEEQKEKANQEETLQETIKTLQNAEANNHSYVCEQSSKTENNDNNSKANLSVYWECVQCGEWNRCVDLTMHTIMCCTQCHTPKLHGAKMVSLLSVMPDDDHTQSSNAQMEEHKYIKPILQKDEEIYIHDNCSNTTNVSATNNNNNNSKTEKKKSETNTDNSNQALNVTNTRHSVFIPWPMNIMFLPWQVWDPSVPYACVVKHSKFETHERIFLYHVANNGNNNDNNNNNNTDDNVSSYNKRKKSKKDHDYTKTKSGNDSFSSSVPKEEFGSNSSHSNNNNNNINISVVDSSPLEGTILSDNEYSSSLSLSLSFSDNDDDDNNDDDQIKTNNNNEIIESANDDIVSCTEEPILLHKPLKRWRSTDKEHFTSDNSIKEKDDDNHYIDSSSTTTAHVIAACENKSSNTLEEIDPFLSSVSTPSLLSMLLTTTPLEHDRFISIACSSCQQSIYTNHLHKVENINRVNGGGGSIRGGHCNHHLYKSIDALVKGTISSMSRRVFAGTSFTSGAVVAYVGGTIRRVNDYRVRPDNSPLVIPMHRLMPAQWQTTLQEINKTQILAQSQPVYDVNMENSNTYCFNESNDDRESDIHSTPRHFAELTMEKSTLKFRNDVDFYRRLSELELVVTNEMMYCPCLSIDVRCNTVEHKPIHHCKESRCNSVDDDDNNNSTIESHNYCCKDGTKGDSDNNYSTNITNESQHNNNVEHEMNKCERCHTCEECQAINEVVVDNCNVAFVLTMDGLGSPHVAAVATRAIGAFEALLARTQ